MDSGSGAAAHLSYRYYLDDWSISAHTVETAWYQTLPDGWLVKPAIRYYSQHKADFYAPYFTQARSDGFHSSDYRLASYGSVLAGFKIEKQFGKHTKLDFNAEYYTRRGDLKLTGKYSIEDEPLSSYALTIGFHHTF